MLKVITALVLSSSFALAADPTFFKVEGDKFKPVTKVEVVKALLNDPKAAVIKCQPVELTDKVTLRNK